MSNPGQESPDNDALRTLRDNIGKLNKSTWWNSLIMIGLTVILVILTIILAIPVVTGETFNDHIQQKVFDECFDYYASLSPETGIDETIIQTCTEKAESFPKEVILN